MHEIGRDQGWRRPAALVLTLLGGLLGGILLGRALATTPSSPVQLPINELTADPDKHAGQTVQITGKLTECAGWECSICPEEMTSESADPRRCLSLEFRPLMKGTGFGEEAIEAVFRFASVTINARFDPACLHEHCTDRAPVLFDAHVIATRQRRKSRLGLWLGERTRLVPLASPDAAAVIAAAHKAGYPQQPAHQEYGAAIAALTREFGPSIKAFGIFGQPGNAIVCSAPSGSGSDLWPDSLEGALYAPSINDYYHCNEVRRLKNEWIVQVRA
jgi:hypothetical protein